MSRKSMILGFGLALLWSSAPALAQAPGLDALGNLFGGGGADAAKTAAGAASGATDAATAAKDAANFCKVANSDPEYWRVIAKKDRS